MNKLLKNKKIILIIGGGISAYKSLDLIRLLKKNECETKVILTESGKNMLARAMNTHYPIHLSMNVGSYSNAALTKLPISVSPKLGGSLATRYR